MNETDDKERRVEDTRIFKEISKINDKLGQIIKLEERLENLYGKHAELKEEFDSLEQSHRDHVLETALNLNTFKNKLDDVSSTKKNLINWVAIVATGIIVGVTVSYFQPKYESTHDHIEHTRESDNGISNNSRRVQG